MSTSDTCYLSMHSAMANRISQKQDAGYKLLIKFVKAGCKEKVKPECKSGKKIKF